MHNGQKTIIYLHQGSSVFHTFICLLTGLSFKSTEPICAKLGEGMDQRGTHYNLVLIRLKERIQEFFP